MQIEFGVFLPCFTQIKLLNINCLCFGSYINSINSILSFTVLTIGVLQTLGNSSIVNL